jgi:transposase
MIPESLLQGGSTTRLEPSEDEFVIEMDRPASILDSIRSERGYPFQLALIQDEVTQGDPVQTLLNIHLGGFSTMYYIAVDVSKKVLSVYDGKKDLTFANSTNLGSLKNYLKRHCRDFADLAFLFEATSSYSDSLIEFCARYKIKAFIINPKASHHFAKSLSIRSKTDKIDARMIYQYQKLIDPKMLAVPKINRQAKKLFGYLKSYQLAIKQRVALSNHISHMQDKNLARLLKKELQNRQKVEEGILSRMTGYILEHPQLKKDYERLLTIPGIGKKSAPALLTLFITYQGTNRGQITALCGLDPIKRQSGTSVLGKSKISKHGNPMFRKVLYMPMLSAIRNNARIALFYRRLLENHKVKKAAVMAAMRKMILIAHAIYQNKTEYVLR